MKYLNPLTLLNNMNGGPVDMRDNAALSLLRKKMMAELELSDDKALRINGQAFSKHELLQFFDQLQFSGVSAYHQQIAEDPVLLHFLETGNMKGPLLDKPWYKDANFISFISPYYEPLFTVAVLNSLKQRDVTATHTLFSAPMLMDGAHITASYKPILRYLKVVDNELKVAIAELNEGAALVWKYLAHLVNDKLVQQLNCLPAEFNQWRSDYGISLINLAIAIYQKDFKRSMTVLDLAAQLQTSDFVQERVQIRKKELQGLRKDQLRNRPLVNWLGALTAPFRPRWLSEKGMGVFVLTVFVLLIVGININRMNNMATRTRSHPQNANDFFAGSRTIKQMKYLTGQLQNSSGQREGSPVTDSALIHPQTGMDVYGPAFMAALGPHKFPDTTAMLKTEAHTNEAIAIDSADFIDPKHRQSVRLFNRLEVPLIALVHTPDSFYSSFVSPRDSVFLPLQVTANQIYFYVGNNWTATTESGIAFDSTYRVKGFFTSKYKNSASFFKDGVLVFNLDPDYWRTSNRYIPVEINADKDNLFVNLLDNNATGVDLYLGE